MSEQNQDYCVLAFYHIGKLENPHELVALHKAFIADKDIACRVYISEMGLNGQLSAHKEAATLYVEWIKSHACFEKMPIKIHYWHEHVFPKKVTKYRKQLVALDNAWDYSKTGTLLSPQQWKQMLEQSDEYILIDVRNDYEWEVGHFAGALLPKCRSFREFNEYADKLKEQYQGKKPKVMMYCTGGIRCELYSCVMKEKGFDEVYHLEGGVINYGLQEGSSHWKGKLFVFDDRMAVPISEEKTEIVGKCHQCTSPSEEYYNCANMDCNKLMLCCQECLHKMQGCCSEKCMEAPRVRPFAQQNPHKPFRKYYQYFGLKNQQANS
jgi:UPF0176 protein